MSTLVTLTVHCPTALGDAVTSLLFDLGAGGVEERSVTGGLALLVYGDDEAATEALRTALGEAARALGDDDARWRRVRSTLQVDRDSTWDTAWTAHLRGLALTQRLWLAPEHDESPTELVRIVYRPELAFGDGQHATTRLAATAIEAHCLAEPGLSLLDVGSGTGVLCFAAVLSGAREALGIDLDPRAVEAARVNAELNALGQRVSFEATTVDRIETEHSLVVANIDAETLLDLGPELARRGRSARALLLTGLLDERADELSRAYAALGLDERGRASLEGWTLLDLAPRFA